MATFKNFNPKRVTFIFKGVTIKGYVDGTNITANRSEDAFTKKIGAQGDVVRTQSNDKSGEVSCTLLQTSSSNDVLSAFAITDEFSGLGHGALTIKDLQGSTLIHAANAWIVKMPDWENSNESTDREWTFECAELKMFVGGSLV